MTNKTINFFVPVVSATCIGRFIISPRGRSIKNNQNGTCSIIRFLLDSKKKVALNVHYKIENAS